MQLRSPEIAGLSFIAVLLGGLAVAALAFYLLGNFAALLVIVGVVGFAAYAALGRDRRSEPLEVRGSTDGRHRILVLAHEGLGGPTLIRALGEHGARPEAEEIHVVVPALADRSHRVSSDLDAEVGAAGADLDRLVEEIGETGIDATGEIGDTDPRLALEDALRGFSADEIVVVNPQADRMGPQESESTRRAVEDAPLPVTVLNV